MFKNYKKLINKQKYINHNSFNYNNNDLYDINDYDDYEEYKNIIKIKFNNIDDCYEFEKNMINNYYIYIKKYEDTLKNYNNIYIFKMNNRNVLSYDYFINILIKYYTEISELSIKIFNHKLLILKDLNIIIYNLCNKNKINYKMFNNYNNFIDMIIKGSIFLNFIKRYFDI